jgi:hypothetical protein
MTEYTGTAHAYRNTEAWKRAEAKRARRAAKYARDMERTAEGRTTPHFGGVSFGWYVPGAVMDPNGHTYEGCHRRECGAGFWDVCFTHDLVAVPRWRQRLNRRRERGPVGKPCWASGQRRAGRYVVETAVSISTPGDVAIDAGPRGVWTSWGGWMSAEEAAR